LLLLVFWLFGVVVSDLDERAIMMRRCGERALWCVSAIPERACGATSTLASLMLFLHHVVSLSVLSSCL
jgi:hypothetical protein